MLSDMDGILGDLEIVGIANFQTNEGPDISESDVTWTATENRLNMSPTVWEVDGFVSSEILFVPGPPARCWAWPDSSAAVVAAHRDVVPPESRQFSSTQNDRGRHQRTTPIPRLDSTPVPPDERDRLRGLDHRVETTCASRRQRRRPDR